MSGTEAVVIAAAVGIAVWWLDVRRHPIRRCPSCNGGKKNAGSNSQRWGACRRCGGKGELRRFGARKPLGYRAGLAGGPRMHDHADRTKRRGGRYWP